MARSLAMLLLLGGTLAACESAPHAGPWRAWLESPGGELPFGLELERKPGGEWGAWIQNGPGERLAATSASWSGRRLTIELTHYAATLVATLDAGGRRLDGEWTKRSGAESWSRLPFHAVAGRAPRFAIAPGAAPERLDGRWLVQFSESEEPSVGIFSSSADGLVTGTFLTTTGDYRYLAGSFHAGLLRLSCFDGAHAFLFHARRQPDGTLVGDFWSRDVWHETWTARPEPAAALPDPFALTAWRDGARLDDLVFHDLGGRERSLTEDAFSGKARLIELFGSWCPNCNDAAVYLAELDQRYRDRGLRVVGLAFELTGDRALDLEQLEKYAAHHGIEFPLLLAGTADKSKASAAFPVVDRVRAYPTVIFQHADGRVEAIHTGFAGPATGAEHQQLRQRYEQLIEELLAG